MSATKTFTDNAFKTEVLDSSQPVLVDVWAPWCGPCRAVAPVIDELANEFDGKVKVGKLNVDDNPATPQEYQVSSIPTVLVFQNGEVVERFAGVRAKEDYAEALRKLAA